MNILYKSTLLVYCLIVAGNIILAQEHKAMSFNIRIDVPGDGENIWQNRREGVVDLINHYEPGIIGFQEVFGSQRIYLDSALIAYESIGLGRDGNMTSESIPVYYDTALYKLLEHGTFWLSETQDTASMGWDAAYPRICTYALFESIIDNKEFWVFNVHLDNKGNTARFESAKMILDAIDKLVKANEPVILMGDMNSIPNSKPIEIFKQQLDVAADVSLKEKYGPFGTYNGFEKDIVINEWIDYIFIDNLTVLSYVHIDDKLPNNNCISDHLPVVIKFRF